MITQDSCKKMHDRLHEPCMITQDSFIRFMLENVPKSCTHMHDLTQVSCMNLAKIHNMIMQEIFAWAPLLLFPVPSAFLLLFDDAPLLLFPVPSQLVAALPPL